VDRSDLAEAIFALNPQHGDPRPWRADAAHALSFSA
jgi:hypothetical protein